MSTVTQFERERLLGAMLEEMAEKDYQGAEVEAALRRVGLSGNEWLDRVPRQGQLPVRGLRAADRAAGAQDV